VYLTLRTVNMGLGMAWGFGLIWVLVRALGVDGMAPYVFAAALGLFLSAANLGISPLLYALLRPEYLALRGEGKPARRSGSAVASAFALFLAIAALATLIYLIAVFLPEPAPATASLVIFFAGAALQLPWTVIKAALEATSRHMVFEILDALRRFAMIISLAAILYGLQPLYVFSFHLLVWAVVIRCAQTRLTRIIDVGHWRLTRAGLQHLHGYLRPKLRATALFSLSEAYAYNSAYLVIPLVYPSASALVIYDLFNKLIRTAVNANITLSAAYMPHLTEAWHKGHSTRFQNGFRRLTGSSLVVMAVFSALLWVSGDRIASQLLDGRAEIPPAFFTAVILAAVSNAVQNVAGGLIVRLGFVNEAWHIGLATAALFTLSYALAWLQILRFPAWLLSFSAIYCFGAFMWFARWRHLSAQPMQPVCGGG
jgi:O-antigen/teichoic acid export membrane protein